MKIVISTINMSSNFLCVRTWKLSPRQQTISNSLAVTRCGENKPRSFEQLFWSGHESGARHIRNPPGIGYSRNCAWDCLKRFKENIPQIRSPEKQGEPTPFSTFSVIYGWLYSWGSIINYGVRSGPRCHIFHSRIINVEESAAPGGVENTGKEMSISVSRCQIYFLTSASLKENFSNEALSVKSSQKPSSWGRIAHRGCVKIQ